MKEGHPCDVEEKDDERREREREKGFWIFRPWGRCI
jgi:hypothetical protein